MNAKEKEVLKKLKELVKEFNGLTYPADYPDGKDDDGKVVIFASKKIIKTIKVTAKMTVNEVGSMLEIATSEIADISIELIPDPVFEAYNAVCDDIEALKKESGSNEPDAGDSEDNTNTEPDSSSEPDPGVTDTSQADKDAEKKRIAKEKRDAKKKNEAPKVSKPVPESGKVILELFNLLYENQVDELKPDTMRQVLKLMKK